jgi:MFS family permease
MFRTLRPVFSLLLGIGFLLTGHGLQFTLLPLSGEASGFDTVMLGLLGSSYYVGFVAGCLLGPYVILRAGHIRTFAAMVSTAAVLVLCHSLMRDPLVWNGLRAMTGFSLATLYLVIESWLNDRASNTTRGTVMSAYIVVNFAAFTVGQMMVSLYPVTAIAPFVLAAILISLATLPVALTSSAQPAPISLVRFRPRRLFATAPVAFVGAFMIGVSNGAFWALGAVFATGIGLSVEQAALFVSATVAGGALGQWPVGRLSDRIDRRIVLAMLLVGSTLAGLALGLLTVGTNTLLLMGFVFGVLTLPGYSLAAAHAYDKTAPGEYVETAAGVLLINGLGSVCGPLIAAIAIARGGPHALFLVTAAVQALLFLFIVVRIRVRRGTASADKTDFSAASTAPMGTVIPPGTDERPAFAGHASAASAPEPGRPAAG